MGGMHGFFLQAEAFGLVYPPLNGKPVLVKMPIVLEIYMMPLQKINNLMLL